jgi:acetyl-CoA C-acetyltransferase
MTTQPIWILGGYQTGLARNLTKESLDISDLVRDTTLGTLASAAVGTSQVVHVGNAVGEFYVRQGHLGSLVAGDGPELSGVPASRHEAACAAGGVAVMAAMADLCLVERPGGVQPSQRDISQLASLLLTC